MEHVYRREWKNIELRPLEESDIEYLRKWRNDADNTKYLRQIGFITPDQQREWYRSYLADKDELMFAIIEKSDLGRIVGSLALYHFKEREVEFGKILVGDPEAHGKSVGFHAVQAALDIAFDDLAKQKVKLRVFRDNLPAVKIYKKAGFEVVSESLHPDGLCEFVMEASCVQADEC